MLPQQKQDRPDLTAWPEQHWCWRFGGGSSSSGDDNDGDNGSDVSGDSDGDDGDSGDQSNDVDGGNIDVVR